MELFVNLQTSELTSVIPEQCLPLSLLPNSLMRAMHPILKREGASFYLRKKTMTKKSIWQTENGEPTWFCLVVSAIIGIGGFYAFFILMCFLEVLINA